MSSRILHVLYRTSWFKVSKRRLYLNTSKLGNSLRWQTPFLGGDSLGEAGNFVILENTLFWGRSIFDVCWAWSFKVPSLLVKKTVAEVAMMVSPKGV